jgi:xylulokinase
MDQPRVSALGEGAVFASPDGAHYMALICFLNGSLAREAVRDRHGLDWQSFTTALRQTPPGNGGALMLPYFAPEIVPRVAAAGVVRHHLDANNPQAEVRAVIEAQALSSKVHSEWMGVAIRSLCVTGGASANEQILRVFADVHGCPVHRFETANAAALGAALRAYHGHLKASGAPRPWKEIVAPFAKPLPGSTIQTNPAATKVYQSLIDEYRKLEQAHTG